MKPNKLQAAFALIADFKRGHMTPGAPISDEQIDLLKLLCEELQPSEKFSTEKLEQLVERIARADTEWNRKAQLVIDEFYVLRESGKLAEAQQCRSSFLGKCPSAWYRGIVAAL